ELIIPEEITTINNYQFVGFDVSSIKFHNNITNIGKYAFAYSKFDTIDFGQALDTIYDYMFYGATTSSITIPNNITVIGKGAFEQTNISSVTLSESINRIEANAFRESKLTTLRMYSINYFGEYAFDRTNIYELYFNGTIYDWLDNNFAYETSTPMNTVTTLYLNSLIDGQMMPFNGEIMFHNYDTKLIGKYQFKNFTNLYYVLLPDTLEEIGQGAFMNTNISHVNIPYSVVKINDYAFANTNLNSLILSENLTFIGFGIIQNTPVSSIEIPYLGESPTGEAKYQNIAYLYGHLEYDDYRADYPNLYSVKVSNGVLGVGAFYNCYNLHELEIPVVSTIPAYAFYNCGRLSDLDFGDELTSIERNAFENTSIYRLTLPKKINYFGEDAFLNAIVTEIYYEDSLSNWSRIKTFNMHSTPVKEESTIYSLVNDEFKQDNIIVVPEDVTILHPYIFSNFDNVDEIHILSNVTYINEGIIYECDMIEKLVLPFIGSEISEYAVANTIEHLVKSSWINNIVEIELLEGTKILQPYSFAHIYSLKKFTLPKSVKTIYNYAFNNSLIEEFVYNGTLEDWNKVLLDTYDSNPAHNGANVYMYNDNNEKELLKEIIVPSEGVYIEKFQYAGFNSVSDVYISNNILVIAQDAFINCESIENVYYDSSLENWLKIYPATLKANPNYYSDNFYVLENSEYIIPTEAVIPDADNNRIYYELVGISSITKVTIPNSKEYIYVDAFNGCDGIEEIYYQGNLKDYLAITSYGYIDHPYTLYVYDDFGGYTTLTNVVMGEYDPVMSYQFTSIKTLETITIDKQYFEFPQHFVAHCVNLKNVIIPTNTRFDNYKPFIGCVNLEGNRYNGCIYIGNEENPYLILVGTYDKEMTELIIHDDTKGIVSDALYGCKNIKTISTPINVSLDYFTFDRDYEIDIDTIIYRGNEDLMRCGLSPNKVVFENGILSANEFSGPLSERTIEEVIFVNANYVNDITRDSWIYKEYMNAYGNGYYLGNEENPYMVLCYVDTNANNVTIHEDTEVIASYAFSYCYSLTEIAIPESVKYISEYAFVNCNQLASVKLNSIKGVGVGAFAGTNLSYIVIPETAELIQFTAFDSNVVIYVEGNTLPSNLEESSNVIYLKNEWTYDSNGIPYVII
ncbi:MAG: leucine-rich repeat protein, partial [Acholeplasmatales bacterium]|nr:leucine-rich repeat protein [Acholeplasmatales bacterium]